jgi:transcriptional regulator with XRE-family HTH domain
VLVKRTHKGPLQEVLAANLRRLRAARGWSQEALAHESGVNRTYLSSVERAERNISIDNIGRIAKALEVEPWWLLKTGVASYLLRSRSFRGGLIAPGQNSSLAFAGSAPDVLGHLEQSQASMLDRLFIPMIVVI